MQSKKPCEADGSTWTTPASSTSPDEDDQEALSHLAGSSEIARRPDHCHLAQWKVFLKLVAATIQQRSKLCRPVPDCVRIRRR